MLNRLENLITSTAACYPNRTAICCVSGESITYHQFLIKIRLLQAKLNLGPYQVGDNIIIYGTKSIEMIMAMFACLFNGLIYIPIEGELPIKRLQQIIEDSQVKACLVNERNYKEQCDLLKMPVVMLEKVDSDTIVENYLFQEKPYINLPAHALTLYTSGSTGISKGIKITHENVLNFINWAVNCFHLTEQDRVSGVAPLHFDLSLFDIFATMKVGATLYLVPPTMKVFPIVFTKWLLEQNITILYAVPTFLIQLCQAGKWHQLISSSLRSILFAGEVFPISDLLLLRKLYPNIILANLYGPAETNVCTWFKVPNLTALENFSVLPIGQPIDNLYLFVLGEHNQELVEIGAEGELCCVGPSVSPGYIKSELDQDRFFIHHLGRGYKTGDLVKLTQHGFVFIGRKDRQVKRYGIRIELYEIEACLRRFPGVISTAVIMVKANVNVHQDLIAFVVTTQSLDDTLLIKHCQQYLPKYMLPNKIIFCDALPKTRTDKIDYLVLESMVTNANDLQKIL